MKSNKNPDVYMDNWISTLQPEELELMNYEKNTVLQIYL